MITGYARTASFLDEPKTVFVDVLEHERGVCTGNIPSTLDQRIGLAIERASSLWVFEIRKVVVITMDDDTTVFDTARVISIGGCTANRLRKSKREETDTGHESQDDAQKSHFLTPCALLFGRTDTYE